MEQKAGVGVGGEEREGRKPWPERSSGPLKTGGYAKPICVPPPQGLALSLAQKEQEGVSLIMFNPVFS